MQQAARALRPCSPVALKAVSSGCVRNGPNVEAVRCLHLVLSKQALIPTV